MVIVFIFLLSQCVAHCALTISITFREFWTEPTLNLIYRSRLFLFYCLLISCLVLFCYCSVYYLTQCHWIHESILESAGLLYHGTILKLKLGALMFLLPPLAVILDWLSHHFFFFINAPINLPYMLIPSDAWFFSILLIFLLHSTDYSFLYIHS